MSEVKIFELRNEADALAFRDLNIEWIERYFEVEPKDHKVLSDPYTYIINPGGAIFMAEYDGGIVGTCALVKDDENTYELAKMAVTPKAQGKQIGYLLGKAIIEKARALGGKTLYLLSNTGLAPALSLYKKLGFREVPLANSQYTRTDIKMELSL